MGSSFAVCLVALGSILVASTNTSFARERRQARADLAAVARHNANLESDAVEEVGTILSGLAAQPAIQSLRTEACQSVLAGLESVSRQGSLLLIAPDRSVVCTLQARAKRARDVPAGDWFGQIQASSQPRYAGLRLDPTSHIPQVMFAAPVPTARGVAVLLAVLDSASSYLEVPADAADESVVIELDRDRTMVVATSPAAPVRPGPLPADSWLRHGFDGHFDVDDVDGVQRMYEVVPVAGLDRVVLAGLSSKVALHEATAERQHNLLVGLLTIGLVVLLGFVVERGIARPLARLQSAIRSAGDDGSVQAEIAGPAEITALADEFNATMAKRRQLERDLAESVDRAEEALRTKAHFVANISHEIRTPMNGVLGMISLLRGEELTEEHQDYVDTMHHSAEALMAIINDLLDFSKLEADMVELSPVAFEFAPWVQAAAAPWMLAAREKGVALEITVAPEVPRFVVGDPTRLRQVLSNLVDNAVKFTARGRVEVSASMVDTNLVRVEVTDTGIGVDPRQCGQLFDAFVQADPSTTRRFGGTGLGLAICRQLVTLMDGTIGAMPRTEGHGATFWFELPLRSTDHAEPVTGANDLECITAGRGTVLLAEDNLINQKVARALVEQLGYLVDVTDNGADAVRMVESHDYLAVLMDLQMPRMDGFAAATAIRQDLHSAVPIFALSASVLDEDRARCAAVGMNGHLGKPIDRRALREVLAAASVVG